MKISGVDRLLPLLWLKAFCKRVFLPGEPLSSSMVIRELILPVRCFYKPVLFGQFYNTFTALTTPSPHTFSSMH